MSVTQASGTSSWSPARVLTGTAADRVMDLAAAAIGAHRITSRPHRIHHRPGRSVTRVDKAVLATAAGTRETLLVAHAHRNGLPRRAATIDVEGAELAVWAYPDDPYLPALPRAADRTWIEGTFHDLGLSTSGLVLRRHAYRATRGCVLEVRTSPDAEHPRSWFLKLLRPGRAERLVDIHTRLATRLPVPAVVASDEGLLLLEGLPGTPVRRLLRSGGPLPPAEELVSLSRRLAEIDVGVTPADGLRADPAPQVAGLRADLHDQRDTIDEVLAGVRSVEGEPVTVHGDLHGGQLLAEQGRTVGLLDLDGVGPGLLVHDAGNLVAYLEAQGDRIPAAADRARRYAGEVATAFGQVLDADALRLATAGRWLALAAAAHRARDEPLVRHRIERAGSLARGA